MFQFFYRIVVELEQFDKVSRCACLKPVAAELFLRKRIEQTERIVHAYGIFREVIAIVIGFQLRTSLFISQARSCSQHVNVFLKIRMDFLFADAADFHVTVVHGDVHQVIQITEHADLTELGHSRKQGKADAPVHGLQCSVEGFQGAAVFVLQGFIADGLEHGFVVFINENYHPAACLLACTADDALKTKRKTCFAFPCAVSAFPDT